MSKAKTTIQLEGENLGLWESKYIDCPFCGRDKKLGVTNSPNGLLYHCFSSHCGKAGIIGGQLGGRPLDKEETTRNRRYLGTTTVCSPEDKAYFEERFGIDTKAIYVTEKDEYLFPILDWEGLRVGEVVRQPTWAGEPSPVRAGRRGVPKALTYLDNRAARLAWYDMPTLGSKEMVADDDLVVLVEDQISAMKVCQVTGYTAVALLGSDISMFSLQALRKRAKTSVVLWLDPDMNGKAFELASRIGGTFNDFRVKLSVADPKDLTDTQIEQHLLD